MDKEYIERNDVLTRIECEAKSLSASVNHYYREAISEIYGIVSEVEVANVTEVKHGHWEKSNNKRTCPNCEFFYHSNNDYYNYCPNCGTKMDGAPNVVQS